MNNKQQMILEQIAEIANNVNLAKDALEKVEADITRQSVTVK